MIQTWSQKKRESEKQSRTSLDEAPEGVLGVGTRVGQPDGQPQRNITVRQKTAGLACLGTFLQQTRHPICKCIAKCIMRGHHCPMGMDMDGHQEGLNRRRFGG